MFTPRSRKISRKRGRAEGAAPGASGKIRPEHSVPARAQPLQHARVSVAVFCTVMVTERVLSRLARWVESAAKAVSAPAAWPSGT